MGFEDLFGLDVGEEDVSFNDSKIKADEGQESDSPPDVGQESGSRLDDHSSDDPKKVSNQKTGDDAGDPEGDKGNEGDDKKSLPFDKNPKWIKARAAEKFVQELMDEHGILDFDELREAMATGKGLAESLKGQDVKDLLKNSQAYKEYQKRMADADADDLDDSGDQDGQGEGDGTPGDKKLAKVLKENQQLKSTLEKIRQGQQESEADERAFNSYKQDVDKILKISSEDFPFNDSETTLFKQVMGIDNPSTQVDIDDTQAVRAMVKNSVKQFHTTLQEIKQQTIDAYAAGKLKMQVTDPSKSGDADVAGLKKKNYDPDKQTPDEVLDSGKDELVDLIMSGMSGV